MTAKLRPMVAADLPAVLALERDLFPEDAWTPEMFASEIEAVAAGRYYLVAEDSGVVVGYAGLLAPQPERGHGSRHRASAQADVLTMSVAKPSWGQGIGTALLTALIDEAASRGCDEIFLEVRADNPRAQNLYARHGFTEFGLRRGYYQPSGMDAIVMRRDIKPPRRAAPMAASGPQSQPGPQPSRAPHGQPGLQAPRPPQGQPGWPAQPGRVVPPGPQGRP